MKLKLQKQEEDIEYQRDKNRRLNEELRRIKKEMGNMEVEIHIVQKQKKQQL